MKSPTPTNHTSSQANRDGFAQSTYVEILVAAKDTDSHILRLGDLGVELVNRRETTAGAYLTYAVPDGIGFGGSK